MGEPSDEDVVLRTLLDEWQLPDDAAPWVRGTVSYQARLLGEKARRLVRDIAASVRPGRPT